MNGRCEDECPHVVINGVCTSNCPAGSYLNGRNCVPCSNECGTCGSSADDCTSCNNGLFTYKGDCVTSCPTKTLEIEDYCIDCDASCDGCVSNPFTCLDCKPGYYHLSGRCVNTCPDGYYTDHALQSCRQCDAFCKVCNGPGQCQLCEDFTRNPVEQCNNQCGANCLKCEDYECTLCAEGTIWTGIMCLKFCPAGSEPVNGVCVCNVGYIYQNQCISVCPVGTLAVDGKCIECSSNCAQCSNTIDFCTAC